MGDDDFRRTLPLFGFRGRALDFVPTARSKEIDVELEELGYGAVRLPEMAGRDVFVHLPHLLSATRTLIGATGVASIWARDPLAMACSVRALTEAYPERVLLGLGVSHKVLVENLRGHEYSKPLSTLRDYIERMNVALYRAERPTTPIRLVVGALGPAILKSLAEETEGANPYLAPPEHSAWARELVGPTSLLCPDQMVLIESDP